MREHHHCSLQRTNPDLRFEALSTGEIYNFHRVMNFCTWLFTSLRMVSSCLTLDNGILLAADKICWPAGPEPINNGDEAVRSPAVLFSCWVSLSFCFNSSSSASFAWRSSMAFFSETYSKVTHPKEVFQDLLTWKQAYHRSCPFFLKAWNTLRRETPIIRLIVIFMNFLEKE